MSLLYRELQVSVAEPQTTDHLKKILAAKLCLPPDALSRVSIQKRSLDARKKSSIHYVYQLKFDADLEEKQLLDSSLPIVEAPSLENKHPLHGLQIPARPELRHRPVVIGTGPAGTFAGLVLAEAGIPCDLYERGEGVENRLKTVGKLLRRGEFNSESNYCFGEGGAGTFSDGKLTCGRNHPLIRYLFQRWVDFGAPESILWEAHPHIGTDYLLRIAKLMRQHLESLNCRFHFSSRLAEILPGDSSCRFKLRFDRGEVVKTDHIVLAIGHSARDTYTMLLEKGLAIAPKPFAIGARFEHPQEKINAIQYGHCTSLPAAEYKLVAQSGGRGIWTFCMCPGGNLLPTGAQPGHLAINGMSYHARNSGFANAAVVVNIQREDFFKGHPLDGMYFQARLEQAAFAAGGGSYFSPAQRLTDFLKGTDSRGELLSTYKPGVRPARLDRILPAFVVEALQAALMQYNQKMRGYISNEAIVAGVESKTSSPIVMLRGNDLQSVSHPGLFPAGEGAGFAGGIVSASLDGVRVARALVETLPQVCLASPERAAEASQVVCGSAHL